MALDGRYGASGIGDDEYSSVSWGCRCLEDAGCFSPEDRAFRRKSGMLLGFGSVDSYTHSFGYLGAVGVPDRPIVVSFFEPVQEVGLPFESIFIRIIHFGCPDRLASRPKPVETRHRGKRGIGRVSEGRQGSSLARCPGSFPDTRWLGCRW